MQMILWRYVKIDFIWYTLIYLKAKNKIKQPLLCHIHVTTKAWTQAMMTVAQSSKQHLST